MEPRPISRVLPLILKRKTQLFVLYLGELQIKPTAVTVEAGLLSGADLPSRELAGFHYPNPYPYFVAG